MYFRNINTFYLLLAPIICTDKDPSLCSAASLIGVDAFCTTDSVLKKCKKTCKMCEEEDEKTFLTNDLTV